MWKKYKKFTIDQINNSELSYDPYCHLVLDTVFHPELFAQISKHWPLGDSAWVKNTQGLNRSRIQYALPGRDGFWHDFYYEFLSDSEFYNVTRDKMRLAEPKTRYVSATLWSDKSGYQIGSHVDQPKIYVAWMTYIHMPKGAKGTELYRDEKGTLAKALSNQPNTGWLMLNDAYSWHGLPEQNVQGARDSVMVRFMK